MARSAFLGRFGSVAIASALAWLLPPSPAAAQANPGPPVSQVAPPESARAWNVVFLNEGDQGLPAFLMIDSALRAALAAPGRHAVNAFSSLSTWQLVREEPAAYALRN